MAVCRSSAEHSSAVDRPTRSSSSRSIVVLMPPAAARLAASRPDGGQYSEFAVDGVNGAHIWLGGAGSRSVPFVSGSGTQALDTKLYSKVGSRSCWAIGP